MMKELVKAKKLLLSGGYTCVLYKDDDIYTSTQRGVKPLANWVESGHNFQNYIAGDKVVGKATAFLYVLLGVKAVYAHVISKAALQVLNQHNICLEYDELVEHIINRRGDGICPFEEAVLDIDDSLEAHKVIRRKMKRSE